MRIPPDADLLVLMTTLFGVAAATYLVSKSRGAPMPPLADAFAPLRPPPPPGCWAVLGLPDTATEDEIVAAHRHLARTNHPDQGGTHERMTAINVAKDEALAIARARSGS